MGERLIHHTEEPEFQASQVGQQEYSRAFEQEYVTPEEGLQKFVEKVAQHKDDGRVVLLVSRGISVNENGEVFPPRVDQDPSNIQTIPNQEALNGGNRAEVLARLIEAFLENEIDPNICSYITTSGPVKFPKEVKGEFVTGIYAQAHWEAVQAELAKKNIPMPETFFFQVYAGSTPEGKMVPSKTTMDELTALLSILGYEASNNKLGADILTDYAQGPRLALMLSCFGYIKEPTTFGAGMIDKTKALMTNNPYFSKLKATSAEAIIADVQKRQDRAGVPILDPKAKGYDAAAASEYMKIRTREEYMIRKGYEFIGNTDTHLQQLDQPHRMVQVAERLFSNLNRKEGYDLRELIDDKGRTILDGSAMDSSIDIIPIETIHNIDLKDNPDAQLSDLVGALYEYAGMEDVLSGKYYAYEGEPPLPISITEPYETNNHYI